MPHLNVNEYERFSVAVGKIFATLGFLLFDFLIYGNPGCEKALSTANEIE